MNKKMSFRLKNLFIFLTIIVLTGEEAVAQEKQACLPIDSGPVIPTTPLVIFLEKLQETALNTYGHKGFDPKLYVDMSLKFNLSDTHQAFNKLPRTDNGSVLAPHLDGFLSEYINAAGDDLVYVEPVDFVAQPVGFLPDVDNLEVRAWALEVHSLWKNLSRKVSDRVLDHPDLHSLLPMASPVMIPGSRFREVYYWDSYWVIRGLLASKMYDTAKGIVTNLVSMIETFGHVLNGARAYYTNRSQPPLLSAMIVDIYNRTGDLDFVRKSLPSLITEHNFWNSGMHRMNIEDSQGTTHYLSRYYAMWNEPRPESSTIDKETADKLSNFCEKQHLYRELASAAESGWDFSTRWMRNASDLTTLCTTSIIPVDLNAFILKMELDISYLANVSLDKSTAERFARASKSRQTAMNAILWNEEMGQWLDYWIDANSCSQVTCKWKALDQNKSVFASNFIPLWIQPFNSDNDLVEKVSKSLQHSGLLRDAGIATSLTNTGQQWDFPNGWAPLQHMIVEGLVKSGSKEARSLAEDIAMKWIKTNYAAYKENGTMHEKYDVEKCGAFGGGGEYVPQTGFGWSNGVVLAFLEEFGWPKDLKIGC